MSVCVKVKLSVAMVYCEDAIDAKIYILITSRRDHVLVAHREKNGERGSWMRWRYVWCMEGRGSVKFTGAIWVKNTRIKFKASIKLHPNRYLSFSSRLLDMKKKDQWCVFTPSSYLPGYSLKSRIWFSSSYNLIYS